MTDRLIQPALLQVLQPILDPTFSEHSYGFRPGPRAQDAVLAAQAIVQSGRRVVVDVDLEKFFDRVNHDILNDRLSKRFSTIPVVIHSSLTGATNEGHVKSVGADAYVAKFVAEELASTIRQVLMR